MDNEPVDLTPYPNRWVAVVHGRVAGVGKTRQQAYGAAKRIRPKDKSTLLFVNDQGQPLTLEQTWLKRHTLLQQTVDVLHAQNIEAYLVGGAVRDLLLEREPIVDLDFAVPADGVRVARQVANALNAAFYPLDIARDTGRVVCQTETPIGSVQFYLDFASYRGPTLQADLADRDFTINAIALSLTHNPQLIDPWQGQHDLGCKQIKIVSESAFKSDPVRVLRAIRQAAGFGFSIEAETEQLLRQTAPSLNQVSPERQRDELYKLLNTPAPGQAVQLLQQLAILPHILPEVESMVGEQQSTPHHLAVFEHTVAALDAWAAMCRTQWADVTDPLRENVDNYLHEALTGHVSIKTIVPLALLLHDTGKPLTRSEDTVEGQTKVRFLGHEKESATIARRVLERFRFSSQATNFVVSVVAHHMRPLHLATEKTVSRRAIYRLFKATKGGNYQAGVAVALHALADHRATYPPGQGAEAEQRLLNVIHRLLTAYFEQREQVVSPAALLTGRDLIDIFGLPQGQLIGLLLRRLTEAQATGQVHDQETALAFIKSDPDFARYQADEL